MDALPLELFDHIISFIPLRDGSRYPSQDLLCCTAVSKTLSILSRRRMFSTLIFGPASTDEKTRAALENLVKLFQDHPDLIRSTHAVEIHVVGNIIWPTLNDALLHNILDMIQSRPQKLMSLTLSCCSALEITFGRRTQETIMHLVPSLHSLSLDRTVLSSTLLKKIRAITHVDLFIARMDIQGTDASRIQGCAPIFAPHSNVSMEMFTMTSIHESFQQHGQSPPSYSNLSINICPRMGTYSLYDLLRSSIHTLRGLTINVGRHGVAEDFKRIDFTLFKSLTTLRITYDHYIDQHLGILVPLWTCLWLTADFLNPNSEFDKRCFPSSLVNVQIGIALERPISHESIGINPFRYPDIPQLQPQSIATLHPHLDSLLINITPPILQDCDKSVAVVVVREEVGRCIKILLPDYVEVREEGIVYRAPFVSA